MLNHLNIIKIDRKAIAPIYLQVSDSIEMGIKSGALISGHQLPSINDLCCILDVSKNTIEKAYNILKTKGLLQGAQGKGYYIVRKVQRRTKILLLFNKLSIHKKIIFDSFISVVGNSATVDLCIYNNSITELAMMIDEKIDEYAKFVIIPPYISNDDIISGIIKKIPSENVFLLDRFFSKKELYRGAVYQDFQKDIYGALVNLSDRISKYQYLKLLFPDNNYFSDEILFGFKLFCRDKRIPYSVINDFSDTELEYNTAYISLREEDLVFFLQKAELAHLKCGADIGLISYNETLIKKFLLNGITTISTDFCMMGEMIAKIVLENSNRCFAVPFQTICRNSL